MLGHNQTIQLIFLSENCFNYSVNPSKSKQFLLVSCSISQSSKTSLLDIHFIVFSLYYKKLIKIPKSKIKVLKKKNNALLQFLQYSPGTR